MFNMIFPVGHTAKSIMFDYFTVSENVSTPVFRDIYQSYGMACFAVWLNLLLFGPHGRPVCPKSKF